MKKILITGGACAGKTTSLNIIRDYLTSNGYQVYIVEEVPTMLINKGITSKKVGKMQFQELIIKTQIANEMKYYTKYKDNKNVIVIYDGSPIDTLKFIKREEFDNIVCKYDLSYEEIISNYDGIIFMQTIANKYPELYSNENNKARLTDVNEAIRRNDLLLEQYKNSNNLFIIDNYEKLEHKKDEIINCIKQII